MGYLGCAGRVEAALYVDAEGKPVRWQFNLGKAREKMAWAYPEILK